MTSDRYILRLNQPQGTLIIEAKTAATRPTIRPQRSYRCGRRLIVRSRRSIACEHQWTGLGLASKPAMTSHQQLFLPGWSRVTHRVLLTVPSLLSRAGDGTTSLPIYNEISIIMGHTRADERRLFLCLGMHERSELCFPPFPRPCLLLEPLFDVLFSVDVLGALKIMSNHLSKG